MGIKKNLKTLVNNNPEFSNQALENAITDIKTKVNSDWVTKTFTLDTAIRDNTVLTTTQKNTILDDINFIPYLNIGRYLNDLIRHTNTILDGSIIPGDPTILGTPEDQGQGTFLECLQLVQGLQSSIPDLYGVPASELNRDVNDHFGSLNNKFLQTEDSSLPVFDAITENLQQMMRLTNHSSPTTAVADGGGLETDIDALLNFINSVVADSTDFQQTLDLHVLTLKNEFIGLNLYLTNLGIYGNHADIQAIQAQAEANYNAVENQRLLEISNLSGIRAYVDTLSDNDAYTGLAEDPDLRAMMTRVSQNPNWKKYFTEYDDAVVNKNPIYDTVADKSVLIDQILASSGLPDVLSSVDLEAVAEKATRDSRIDTKGYEALTINEQITDACKQLSITTAGRGIFDQSNLLLNNLNKRDRDLIANELDLSVDADTLS
jgi:hypothetical protein